MSLVVQERPSDAPHVHTVMFGQAVASGTTLRPASAHWHLVVVHHDGQRRAIVVGPLRSTGIVRWSAGAEILWIKFKLGVYLPHMPALELCDHETPLPSASDKTFYLHGAAWQFPRFDNADTFVRRLARSHVLLRDPVVSAALHGRTQDYATRTVRHHFHHITGLSQRHIAQIERAQRAASLLGQGVPILDVVEGEGYFDQPHLTRSLRRWTGMTPGEFLRRPVS
jgi:AraC-like DNA-binding protein